MITCNFCGIILNSIEDYEIHIDVQCSIAQTNDSITELITGIIHPDGRIELKTLRVKFPEVNAEKLADEKKHLFRTDEEETEPRRMRRVSVRSFTQAV